MGLFSKDIKTMQELFLHTLQDVYFAENQIVRKSDSEGINEDHREGNE